MSEYAVLHGHEVRPVAMMVWARWFAKANRTVARTNIAGCEVSTVFLGSDHSFGEGPPLWFETLVFGGPYDGDMDRYTTWEEAERGHAAMIERVSQPPTCGPTGEER